jgi:hypothetical protein
MPYFCHIEATYNIACAIKDNKNQHCVYAMNETLAVWLCCVWWHLMTRMLSAALCMNYPKCYG